MKFSKLTNSILAMVAITALAVPSLVIAEKPDGSISFASAYLKKSK